ncbi:MAG: hypothetical protein ACR2QW_00080, partial [bacterium]
FRQIFHVFLTATIRRPSCGACSNPLANVNQQTPMDRAIPVLKTHQLDKNVIAPRYSRQFNPMQDPLYDRTILRLTLADLQGLSIKHELTLSYADCVSRDNLDFGVPNNFSSTPSNTNQVIRNAAHSKAKL